MNTLYFEYDCNGIILDVEVEYYKGDDAVIDIANPEYSQPSAPHEVENITATNNGSSVDIESILEYKEDTDIEFVNGTFRYARKKAKLDGVGIIYNKYNKKCYRATTLAEILEDEFYEQF